jgi:hypothetical protein
MEEELEMGKRPSRQRRHLPTSATLAASSRSKLDTKNIPLLRMTFSSNHQDEQATVKGTRRNKRIASKNSKYNNDKVQPSVQSKRKKMIWIVSCLWILFILYRLVICFKKEDYGSLSIVHFISNAILNR